MNRCDACDRGPFHRAYPWCLSCFQRSKCTLHDDKFIPLDTYKRDYDVYIAGPFFNPEQLEIVDQIREGLDEIEVPYFSPYHEGGVVQELDHKTAEKIFILDYMGIVHAKWVCAILTYEGAPLYNAQGHQLSLSDTGTVWEMGAAFALRKPVVGYYPMGRKPNKLNLMLSECFETVIEGVQELQTIAKFGFDALRRKWDGRVQ